MTGAVADPRIARGMTTQLALRRTRLDAGEKARGWKVGFGAPAAMERLALTAPLVGFLTDRALVTPGSSVSLAHWSKPVAEPEIAVYLGRDLPGGADRATTEAAIAGLGPAIELADVDRQPDDVESILAGNIYQRSLVLGRCDTARAGGKREGLLARVIRNGSEVARTSDLQALTGEMIDIVRHVANVLAVCGERLRAGELIITGSIVPPLWVLHGEELVFALDPIGSVAIRFEPKETTA
jgi:2-keto-4-pentenoate hydratase